MVRLNLARAVERELECFSPAQHNWKQRAAVSPQAIPD
jgi:hypothetical protein